MKLAALLLLCAAAQAQIFPGRVSRIGPTAAVAGTPSILLNISSVPTTYTNPAGGDNITFTYQVQNTGNVPLTGFTVVGSTLFGTFSCITGTLPPTGSANCTQPYTTTTTDVSNGQIIEKATVQSSFNGSTVSSNTPTDALQFTGNSISVTDTSHPGLYGGAKCDGATDDRAAFQLTLNYASANNIPTVTMPGLTCIMGSFVSNYGIGYNLQLPSGVQLKGATGVSKIQVNASGVGNTGGGPTCGPVGGTFFCPVFVVGPYGVSWSKSGPFYPLNNTVIGSPTVTTTTVTDAGNFHVGDYIAFYEEYPDNPHCWDCDVIPAQIAKVTSANSGNGQIGLSDNVVRAFTNGSFTSPGSGRCNGGTGGSCTPSNTGTLISASACAAAGSACTLLYASLPNQVIAVNITSRVTHDNGINGVIIQGGTQLFVTEVYNFTLTNCQVIGDISLGVGLTWEWNSIEHSTISNNLFTSNFNLGQFVEEGPQRNSGNNLWQNNTFGDSSGHYFGTWGTGEFNYNDTYSSNTIYTDSAAAANNGDNGFQPMGQNIVFNGNTLNTIGNWNGTNAAVLADETVASTHSGLGTNHYTGGIQLTNNTINCIATGQQCIFVVATDTVVSGNTINVQTGSTTGIGIYGIGFSTNTQITGNHINLLGGTGISWPGLTPDNWKINGNFIKSTAGGTGVSIAGSSASGTGCQLENNTNSGGLTATLSPAAATIAANHPTCTVSGNTVP